MIDKKVALVVGASRGIGRQIAIDLAKNDYAVVVAAKSTSHHDGSSASTSPPDPNSPSSTIHTVVQEIHALDHTAVAIPVDVRSYVSIRDLISQTIAHYGHLDVLVYNAGAIWWASVEDTPMRRFQLMQQVNAEGLYGCVQAVLPHLKREGTGRIVVVSPPIYSRFFRGKTAYAMGKVAMSVLTKGLAIDLERQGLKNMAITSIWPAVSIESGATRSMTASNPSEAQDLRKATIFSDAILAMLRAQASSVNGRLELDEDYLRTDWGVTDFSKYAVVPGSTPRRIMPLELPDLRVKEQDDEGKRMDSAKERRGKGAKL